jgi:hypothetical protein
MVKDMKDKYRWEVRIRTQESSRQEKERSKNKGDQRFCNSPQTIHKGDNHINCNHNKERGKEREKRKAHTR